MKKIRLLFCLLVVLFQGVSLSAKAQSFTLHVYLAAMGSATQMDFFLDVLTTEGVYHGEYYQTGKILLIRPVPNRAWSGPGNLPAPELEVTGSSTTVSDSNCPGIENLDSGWNCQSIPLKITATGSPGGCPWLVTTRVYSTTTQSSETYMGPQTVQSTCPSEPLTPYDVSWDENSVVRTAKLQLQSTGGVIERTLSTFLMKDGKLCDGSQLDERGAYCRFVAQMITFTASGCDNAKVTVTPTPHPVTDRQLHDILVHVDTTAQQPINSTCRFQYVLNML